MQSPAKGAVEELMRRLRQKDKELAECHEQIKGLNTKLEGTGYFASLPSSSHTHTLVFAHIPFYEQPCTHIQAY